MNFFFWFFLVGFLLAALQDLKRREVDNWLNLFLFFSGFLYILSQTFHYSEPSFLINFAFLVFLMFGLAYLFYFARVFAGGDCKLLFAVTPLLVSVDFIQSFQNVAFFSISLLFLGALYGSIWIFGLFLSDLKKNLRDFYLSVKKSFSYILLTFLIFLLGFIDKLFFSFFILINILIFIFFISKVVEKNSLIRKVYSKDLREGDWLDKPILFKGKKFQYSFDGLSLEDIFSLKFYKKEILIKDGIPFAPVFIFSWILFYYSGVVLEVISKLIL